MEEKILKIYMSKGGAGSVSARLTLPLNWIRALGIKDSTSIPAQFDPEKEQIVLFKKKEHNEKIIKEITNFIKKYNKFEGEKIFWEEIAGKSISSHKADKIEIIENKDYFYFIFKFKERELQGDDIYYSDWCISTDIQDNKFIMRRNTI